jgi:stage V sporulation protein B
MDKAIEMGQTSAVGSLQLFLGRTLGTIILAIGTITLGLFISQTDYGLYGVALIPSVTFLLFQDWGVGTALTRFIAQRRSINAEIELSKIILSGLIFEVTTGVILTLMLVLMANFMALVTLGRPESAFLITISSITILMSAIGSASGCILMGFEKMKLSGYVVIIQSIVQGVVAPVLVALGYGAVGAMVGYTLSATAGGIVTLLFVYFFIIRKLPKSKLRISDIKETLSSLLRFGTPIAASNIVSGLGGQFFGYLMAAYVYDAMIGNNKIAANFGALVTTLSYSIATVLYPAFSKIDPHKEKDLLKTVYASSAKYTVLFVLPVILAMMVLSKPLIGTIYGDKWPDAPLLLTISLAYNLLSIFGWRSMGALLPAMGETKLMMKMNLLGFILTIPIGLVLAPTLGIIGIIIGPTIAALPGTFIGIYVCWKRYGVKTDLQASARVLIASILATLTVYGFLWFFRGAYWISFFVGVFLFLIVFLMSAPIVGAVNQADIKNLRLMFKGSGIILKIFEIILKIMEKTLKIFSHFTKSTT